MKDSWNTIPKTSVGKKRVIWRDVTIWDLGLILVGLLISILCSWTIPKLETFVKIIICLGINLIFVSLVLIKNKKTGLRLYQTIYVYVKFMVTKKRYSTQELGVQKELNVIIGDRYIIPKKESNKEMSNRIGGFKVFGIDLGNNDIIIQEQQILTLNEIFKQNEYSFKIVSVNETHCWEKNIKSIQKAVDVLKERCELEKIEDEQWYKSRLNQLESQLQFYLDQNENKDFLTRGWYIIYSGDANKIDDIGKELKSSFERMFYCDDLSGIELADLMKRLWNPLNDYSKELKTSEESVSVLPEGKINFKENWFMLADNYYSIGTLSIEQMPLTVKPYWLYHLSQYDPTMVINVSPIKKEEATKLIQRTINNTAYVANQYNEYKNSTQKEEYTYQNGIINQIKDELAHGVEKLMEINVYFISYGGSNVARKESLGVLKQGIKDEGMVYNDLNCRQKEFFGSVLLNGSDIHSKSESFTMPCLSLASSFPFQNSVQIDNSGVMLGTNNLANPVVLDINLRNRQRINSNALIIGNTGSGKTTTVKKILSNHIANDGIAFILDPEQDYVHLTQYYEGKIIDASNGNSSKINPLQVMLNESDDELENTSQNLISNHLSLVMTWFKMLDFCLTKLQEERLSGLITDLYREWDLFNKNLYELDPNDYPTFKDLYNYIEYRIDGLRRECNENKNIPMFDKLYNEDYGKDLLVIKTLISNNFMNGGMYEALYNGYSSLKIGDNDVIDFDVKNLLANSSNSRKSAQMLLIIAYIQNAINLNGYQSKNPKHALLVVDEAHLFIDDKNPEVLIFLSQMSKRIRKRNGGVWITTQNPSDFITTPDILRYTRALVENVQYTFIHSLRPNDANAIVEMYQNSPNPITESEKSFIQQDANGQCLLIVSNRQRQNLEVMVSEEEFKAIGKDPRDRFDISKIDMSINWESFDNDVIYA